MEAGKNKAQSTRVRIHLFPTKCRKKAFFFKVRSKVRIIVTYPQIVILLIGYKWPHDADILPTVFA